ncbi:MAG: hypothetical protein KOO62_12985 [candidate division Zixibacteria bacterium]|nr:hypothetical protein [candidate division Zixibacteria bacterium]
MLKEAIEDWICQQRMYMKGKKAFTEAEARDIRNLLSKKERAQKSDRKRIRDELRSIGFYITDWDQTQRGFGRADFDTLVQIGQVRILESDS